MLRNAYVAVRPGYHLNKKHWNTITLDGSIPHDELADLIQHSYELVIASVGAASAPSCSLARVDRTDL